MEFGVGNHERHIMRNIICRYGQAHDNVFIVGMCVCLEAKAVYAQTLGTHLIKDCLLMLAMLCFPSLVFRYTYDSDGWMPGPACEGSISMHGTAYCQLLLFGNTM
jgi:hypothetical protein